MTDRTSSQAITAIDIEADAATVYEAVATTEGQRSFWTSDCDVAEDVGGKARFGFPVAEADLTMVVEDLTPGQRVAWSVDGPWPFWGGTTISWELARSDRLEGGTVVLLRHADWSDDYPEVELARVTETWSAILVRLKGYLESGEPQPYFG